MKSYRKELWFNVPGRRALTNITPQVEECLARVRAVGYDASLVLQATLAFAPRGQLNQDEVEELGGASESSLARFKMSPHDKKFLRSLKIAVDEEA